MHKHKKKEEIKPRVGGSRRGTTGRIKTFIKSDGMIDNFSFL